MLLDIWKRMNKIYYIENKDEIISAINLSPEERVNFILS